MHRILRCMRAMVCAVAAFGCSGLSAAVAWREGFEAGAPGWTIEGGTWEIGEPKATPGPAALAGAGVAGTVLAGAYGNTHDARLITPPLVVPAAAELPRFTYHQWYQIGWNDRGRLQVRVAGGAWQDVAGELLTEAGSGWARRSVDLRAFAGQTVQLAFWFVAAFDNRAGDRALGWYVDEAALETGPMALPAPEGFEHGFGDWSVEGGVWQVGVPTAAGGPAAFEGANLVGTNIAGHYGTNHDARLVTPEFTVPDATQAPRFTFHSWHQIGGQDYGQLQLRVAGGAWQDVPGGRLTESAESWARHSVDLRAFAGQAVQLAFRLVAVFENRQGDLGLGWYIDAAALETGPMTLASPEGFEGGFGDWSVEGGVWQVGAPAIARGPAAFAGSRLAGTTLTANYGTTHDARLLTPEFVVPAATAAPRFSYHYWHELGGGDFAQLQIRPVGGAWQDVTGERLAGAGGAWARRSVDLRAHAGQTVQLAFRLVSVYENRQGDLGPGWFIDEARLETGPMAFAGTNGFEGGFGAWSVEGGVWQIGTPTAPGGPTAAAGASVAGTMLAGNYPDNADARLVSPEFIVPPGLRAPQLSVHQWHALQANDRGRVEVSVAGGAWAPLGPAITGTKTAWQRTTYDLTAYAGQPARVAFHLTSDRYAGSAGWYVDDVNLGTVDPAEIALGQSVNGSLPAAGARVLYTLDVPPGGHLRFTLDDLDDAGANEIYVRRGAAPNAGDYDHRFRATGADQLIFAPNAGAGTWFVLLLGATVPEGGNAYRFRADFSEGIALMSVTPTRVGNGFPAVLDISGAGFDSTARVALRTGGSAAAEGATTVIGPDRLRADLTLTDVAPGTHEVTVTQGAHVVSLPLEIVAGGLPRFEAKLIPPGRVGRHAVATLFVEYANLGDVAMDAPLLAVRGSDNALLTLHSALCARGLRVDTYPAGFSSVVQFLASGDTPGLLQPGERKRVPVYYVGLAKPWSFTDTSVQFDLGTIDQTSTDAIDWPSFKAQTRPAHVPADAWDVIWGNFVTAVGPTWGDYAAMLAANARYLHTLGLNVADVHALARFEFSQAEGLTLIATPAAATDATVRQPGLDLVFRRVYRSATSSRFRTGPLGRGWSHNWEYLLTTETGGTKMLLGPAGSRRDFQPAARGGYLSDEGDPGRLSALRDGTFELREATGAKLVFRADGRLDRIEDPSGNRIAAEYAGRNLTRLTHSAGASLTFAYANGMLQSVTDPAGRATTYRYDSGGHLVGATNAAGETETYAYDAAAHALTTVTFADGRQHTFSYDAGGRLASMKRGGGASAEEATFSFDSFGAVTVSDTTGASAIYRFDHRGVPASVDDPLGRRTKLEHDANFNLLSLTTPDGAVTRFEYDPSGHNTRVLDALGNAVTLAYNAAGRVQSVTDARRLTTRFEFDTAGGVTAVVAPDGSRTKESRDARGPVIAVTNRRGQTTTFTRDEAGRITRKTQPDGRTFDFRYDARGNLVSANDSVRGSTDLGYDARDRLTTLRYPDGYGFTFAYDSADRRTRRTGHDGYVLRYIHDDAGRLTGLEDGAGKKIVDYRYYSTGLLAREDKGNGARTTYEYDAAGQLLHLVNFAPDGAIVSRFDSTYDVRGHRRSLATLAGTTRFTYDALGQLTGAIYADGRTVNYQYDAAGNRTQVAEAGTPADYAANALNQYTQAGMARFTYDADGNLASRVDASGTTSFAYDNENRLVQVVSPTDGTWTFDYDAFGNRVRATHDGATAHFVPDPIGLIDLAAEYDGAGTLVARYDHGLGLAQRVTADGSRAFYNFDAMGSTRELVDAAGVVLNRYDYDAFGGFRQRQEALPNRFTFVGRAGVMTGPAGLLNMRRRDYDPVHGRFTTADPIGLDGDLNLYRYAANAPTLFTDPAGEQPLIFLAAPFVGWGVWQAMGIGDTRQLPALMNGGTGRGLQYLLDERDRNEKARQAAIVVGNAAAQTASAPTSLSKIYASLVAWYYSTFWSGADLSLRAQWSILWHNHLRQYLQPPWDFLKGIAQEIVAAVDPNELIGPAGYGPANHVRGDGSFAYRLGFENDRKATAPAQIVEIANPIPAHLDLATLELTSTGFGDVVIPIRAGSQRFEHTETVTMDGVTIEVLIEISVDAATRELRATFSSVMPDSGLPPPVEIGFLPPEDDTGRGMGHVGYMVRPVPALATNTEIRNIGFVTFDRLAGGPTFRTDLSDVHDPKSAPSPARQALVTIDADAPASRVSSLPAKTGRDTFAVSWSGTDTGAGITSYDIYTQTDGGPWARWLDDTAETSAVWTGEYGRRFGFVAVATDGAGLSESAPGAGTAAQAETTMTRPLWKHWLPWTALVILGVLVIVWRRRAAPRLPA